MMKIRFSAIVLFIAVLQSSALNAQASKIWVESDLRRSELIYGSGSKESAPSQADSFTQLATTDKSLLVQDNRGRTWFVLSGPQAKATVATTRLLHALGFYVSENYFVETLNVTHSKKLFRQVCLVRRPDTSNNMGTWSWISNPFIGTQEFEGLKGAMILLSNWGMSQSDNSIVSELSSHDRQYTIMRAGDSLGKATSRFGRSSSSVKEFSEAKFITTNDRNSVTFAYWSQSNVISNAISRSGALWLVTLFDSLPQDHITDSFIAAGYSSEEAESYVVTLRKRVSALSSTLQMGPK
jgi:hypothetical protein